MEYVCRYCKRANFFDVFKPTEYIFDKNYIYHKIVNCIYCGAEYYYQKIKSKDIEDFFLMNNDFAMPRRYEKIICTYTPLPENKEAIETYVKGHGEKVVSVGIEGYETIILDQEKLGNNFMTLNTPPLLDWYVYGLYKSLLRESKIILSYIPSLLLRDYEVPFEYIFGQTEDNFKGSQNRVLDIYKNLYIGVKK